VPKINVTESYVDDEFAKAAAIIIPGDVAKLAKGKLNKNKS